MGKDVAVYVYDGGIWKLYGCAKSCSYKTTTEFMEVTVAGYGVNAQIIPTKNSFSGTIDGLVSLEVGSLLNYPDLVSRQITHQLLMMRYIRTSRAGQTFTSESNFYIESSEDTGTYGEANSFTISLRGTGVPTLVFTPPPPPALSGPVFRYEYTATGGESSFSDPTLVNRYILEVNKDGEGFKVITSGTPVNKEVRYTIGTGTLEFSVPFEPGEFAYALWQEL